MSGSRPSIDVVWARIQKFESQEFETKTGKPFTYTIHGDVFRPSRTKYNIPRSEFEKALSLVPFDGPGAINWSVRGPSYVWAVLHDGRIRMKDW